MTATLVTDDGVTLRYRDSGGPGPVFLLSSGVGQSLEFWDRQVEALAGEARLIAWDYPSHGLSSVDPVPLTVERLARLALELLDRLEVSSAILVGNSLGGAVSLKVQSMAPARVRGLVLAAPAFTGPKVFAAFKLFALPVVGRLLTKPSDKGVEMQVAGVFHPGHRPDDALLAVIRRNVFKPGAQEPFLTFMRSTLSLAGVRRPVFAEMHRLYRACACPILFVHGRQDKIIPFEQSQACADLAPDARVMIFEDCGHAPQLERPEKFNALLRDFAEATAAPQPGEGP